MFVEITGPARRDLSAIATYTRKVWGALQCDRYMSALNVKFKRLSRHPRLGAVRNDLRGVPRVLLVGEHITFYDHRIFYEITADAIVIKRVLHQARDIRSELE